MQRYLCICTSMHYQIRVSAQDLGATAFVHLLVKRRISVEGLYRCLLYKIDGEAVHLGTRTMWQCAWGCCLEH